MAGIGAGKAAGQFEPEALHSNMTVAGLLGVRTMINFLVVRDNLGVTDEGGAEQITIDQPS